MNLTKTFWSGVSQTWLTKHNYYLLTVLCFIGAILTLKLDNLYYCGLIYCVSCGLYLLKIKQVWKLFILYLLFLVYLIIFYKLNLDWWGRSDLYYVWDVKPKYAILKRGQNSFLVSIGEVQFAVGEFVKGVGELKKLPFQGSFWEFNFYNYLRNQHVLGELINFNFTPCRFKFLHYWFYQLGQNQHEFIKMLLFQIKPKNELYKNLVDLNLSWLISFGGIFLYPIDYFITKYIFKFNKTYQRWKIVPLSCLFFYCYLLKFPVVLFKVVLLLLFKWVCYIKKLSLSRMIRTAVMWMIVLTFNPFYLFNLGFLYSFLALFLFQKIDTAKWYKQVAFDFGLLSLLFTPLSIFSHFKIYWFDCLYKLILMPLIFLNFILALFFFIPNSAVLYDFLANLLTAVVKVLSLVNVSTLIGHIPVLWLTIYYLGLIGALKIKLDHKKLSKIFIVGSLIFCSTILCENKIKYLQNSVQMINVGNGNSFIINYKQETFMYDVGEGAGQSPTIVKNYYDYLGIKSINTIFISHHHIDHYNLLESVLQNNQVRHVIQNDNKIIYMEYKDMKINIFNEYKNADENDNSMVILFETPSAKMLFMGDATRVREFRLLKDARFLKLVESGIDFFQVGHHGSKTSSSDEFIKTIQPKVCFVSGEKRGKKAFPNDETMVTLNNYHCQNYITASKNSYKYNINNHKVQLIAEEFF